MKKPAKKPAKTATKKPAKKSAKTATKKPAKKSAKTATKKPAKTATKKPAKTATKKPVKKPGKKPATQPTKKPTKRDLAGVKNKLLAERKELERELSEFERRTLGDPQEGQAEAAIDEDYADLGTSTFERERDLSLAENLRDLLEQIDRALERIEERTYGICESCGKKIEAARMRALPYASLCIECKRKEEARR